MTKEYEIATKGVRAGQARTEFQEHSEALFLTSSFVFDNAQQAAARFTGEEEGMVYTRYTNPTVQMFQDRLAALEGAESCVATASGMAAILVTAMVHLKSGDHVVCSNARVRRHDQRSSTTSSPASGSRRPTSRPPGSTTGAGRSARTPGCCFSRRLPTRSPRFRISPRLPRSAKNARALLAVDNVFCTPALQRPLELGADLVIHSATKYLDGQGRVIAGAVAGSKALVGDPMTTFLRTAGPTLSPFNAWVVLKGLETLELRMRAQSAAALELARWLEAHPSVARVHYPGLESHPQHALARRQQRAAGSVLSFEVKGGRAAAWRVIDSTRLVSLTANLGDVKTTIIHPASTTHSRISPEARAAAGITEGLVRLAVGLEALSDLKADLERGLDPDPDRGA